MDEAKRQYPSPATLHVGDGTIELTGIAFKRTKWWAPIFLPILLRALIPVGFMPMIGPGFTLQLVVCDGYAHLPWAATMSADMPMDMPMDMGGDSLDSHGGAPYHGDHGRCPYGSAPALGALPALALLPPLLIQRSLEPALATAQVPYFKVSPRAQSPRAPPV